MVAGFTLGNRVVVVVDDADLVVVADRAALGGDHQVVGVVVAGVVDQPLGHPEDLLQGTSQDRGDAAGRFFCEGGPADLEYAQRGQVPVVLGAVFDGVQPQHGHRGDHRGVGDVFAFDQGQGGVRAGVGGQDDGASRVQDAEEPG